MIRQELMNRATQPQQPFPQPGHGFPQPGHGHDNGPGHGNGHDNDHGPGHGNGHNNGPGHGNGHNGPQPQPQPRPTPPPVIVHPAPAPQPAPQPAGPPPGTLKLWAKYDNVYQISIRGTSVSHHLVAGQDNWHNEKDEWGNGQGLPTDRAVNVRFVRACDDTKPTVAISQQPNASNNYTLVMTIIESKGGTNTICAMFEW
jgi:hypothetical protein